MKDEQIEDLPNKRPEERIEDDPDADPGSEDEYENQQNMSWQPSAAQLADLKLAHANNGHPSNSHFAR
eukprot:3303617-Karenia_brevis.AAC.1